MKTNLTLLFLLIATTTFAQTIRRVNNNPGVTGTNIYTTIQAAHDAAVSGDIVYVEPSTITYGDLRCIKSLKIYGNGYFLSDNPGLQAVTLSSTIGTLEIATAAANGTEVYGLTTTGYTYIMASSNVKIKRCNILQVLISNGGTSVLGGGTVSNVNVSTIELSQNYGFSYNPSIGITTTTGFSISNGLFENNYMYGVSMSSTNISNMIVKNNTMTGSSTILNTVFENNIVLSTGGSAVTATSCTINNNVAAGNSLPVGAGNQNSFLNLDLEFIGGSNDKKIQIKSGSPLLTAGNGGTQVGAYGGTTPYVVSGIPAIPNFTKILSTGTGSSTSPLSITISTKSNN